MTTLQSIVLSIAFGVSLTNFLINLGNTRRLTDLENQVQVLMKHELKSVLCEWLRDTPTNPRKTQPNQDKT